MPQMNMKSKNRAVAQGAPQKYKINNDQFEYTSTFLGVGLLSFFLVCLSQRQLGSLLH